MKYGLIQNNCIGIFNEQVDGAKPINFGTLPDTIQICFEIVDETENEIIVNETKIANQEQKFIIELNRMKNQKLQQYGGNIISLIAAINESKTSAQIAEILTNPTFEKIERCLWNGSFQTAKTLINTIPLTIYTQNEINMVIEEIDMALRKA